MTKAAGLPPFNRGFKVQGNKHRPGCGERDFDFGRYIRSATEHVLKSSWRATKRALPFLSSVTGMVGIDTCIN
jgi:hypothetical protein